MPTALITGVTGQDGALLARHLLDQGWRVCGGFRRGDPTKLWRLQELGLLPRIHLVDINVSELSHLIEVLRAERPDHVYHLAGQSFVADSFLQPRHSFDVNLFGTLNVLESVRLVAPEARVFFASSAEVFGGPESPVSLNETSRTAPISPYGISKLAAQQLADVFRAYHGLHVVSGILFNHESEFRARNFVTRKITYNIARLRKQGGEPIKLGALDAARDWGAARDYVRLMPLVLDRAPAQNYVFATGRATTVRDFLQLSAEAAGFDAVFEGEKAEERCLDRRSGRLLAEVSEAYLRRRDTGCLLGDASRLRSVAGEPAVTRLPSLVEQMISADIGRWQEDGHA